MRRAVLVTLTVAAVALAAAAPAGAYTTKGGSATIPMSIVSHIPISQPILGLDFYSAGFFYPGGVADRLGPLNLKAGGTLNFKKNTASVTAASDQTIAVLSLDQTGLGGTSITFNNIEISVGPKGAAINGQAMSATDSSGASVAPPIGVFKLFSASKGTLRKANSKSYKAIYTSPTVTINPQLAGLINTTLFAPGYGTQEITKTKFGSLNLKLK